MCFHRTELVDSKEELEEERTSGNGFNIHFVMSWNTNFWFLFFKFLFLSCL